MPSDGWSRRRTKREAMEVKEPRRLTSRPPWRGLSTKCEINSEMQGRIGELGREMAKFATSPGMLSTMQVVSTAPQSCTTGLCLLHPFLRRPPRTRIGQPTIYASLRHPRGATTITSAVPNRRLRISSGSVVAGQGALSPPQSPPTTSNSGSASPAGGVTGPVRSRPVSVAGLPALPSTSSTCTCWSASGADGIHVGGPSATACARKVVEY
jgi:hypothetical protein